MCCYGSNYLYIQIVSKAGKNELPQYATDFYYPNKINTALISYPNYVMIKFRGKKLKIDEAYSHFKMIINAKEWNVKKNYY